MCLQQVIPEMPFFTGWAYCKTADVELKGRTQHARLLDDYSYHHTMVGDVSSANELVCCRRKCQ